MSVLSRVHEHRERGRAVAFAVLLVAASLGAMLVAPGAAASALRYANGEMDAVCEYSGAQPPVSTHEYFDQTGAANDAAADYDHAVILADDASNTGSDAVFLGMHGLFDGLSFNIATAGVSGSVSWSYWTGASWLLLSTGHGFIDNTNNFYNPGINNVRFVPPPDWQAAVLPDPVTNLDPATGKPYPDACTHEALYWVKVATNRVYSVQPLAAQISALVENVVVKATTELGEPLLGLTSSAVVVHDGDDPTTYVFRELGGGLYALGLNATAPHRNYHLAVRASGYAVGPSLATGDLTARTTDLSTTPMTAPYALKVLVNDEGGRPIAGATVTWNNVAANRVPAGANAFYFSGTGSGRLAVAAPGFESLRTSFDKAAGSVEAGVAAQTVVTLTGTTPCSAGSAVASGTSATCHGLQRLPGDDTSPYLPADRGGGDGPSATSGGLSSAGSSALPACTAGVQPIADGVYAKTLDILGPDDVLRVCLDAAQAVGLERVDLLLGQRAEAVQVRVEPATTLKPEWTSAGVPASPGAHHFGFFRVTVQVGAAEFGGSAESTATRFHVARSALAAAHLGSHDVRLYRWTGTAWAAAPTRVVGEDSTGYVYAASTAGQGLFAIDGTAAEAAHPTPLWLWGALGLAGALVVCAVLFVLPRRKPPAAARPPGSRSPSEPVRLAFRSDRGRRR